MKLDNIRRLSGLRRIAVFLGVVAVAAPAFGQVSVDDLSVSVRDEIACNFGSSNLYAYGQSVQFSGTGFAPASTISLKVFMRSERVRRAYDLGAVQADGEGSFSATTRLDIDEVATGLVKALGIGSDGNGRLLQGVLFVVESATQDDDSDGVPNICDVCPNSASSDQSDTDQDGIGDACDPFPNDPRNDKDGDGISGDIDICPSDPANDEDGDGVCGRLDNCPAVSNSNQEDSDLDGVGDACLNDLFAHAGFDKSVLSGEAVTLSGSLSRPSPLEYSWFQHSGPLVTMSSSNEEYLRIDVPAVQAESAIEFGLIVSDGTNESAPDYVSVYVAPTVDLDSDGDGVEDELDNCPDTPNTDQSDSDGDGIGDACDTPDEPRQCDIDLDGDVDRADVMLIFAVRNQPAAPGDPRDVDGDGTITVLDGRACTLQCDRPACQ